jgi:hypothetical protein
MLEDKYNNNLNNFTTASPHIVTLPCLSAELAFMFFDQRDLG